MKHPRYLMIHLRGSFSDEDHSNGEQRIVGHSILDRLLLVSFTERETGQVRIVSTRRATRKERKDYEEIIGE